MRGLSVWLFVAAVEAGRVNVVSRQQATLESEVEAGGRPLNTWPEELSSKYENQKKLACGWEACAYLVIRKSDGKKMVIKAQRVGLGYLPGSVLEECQAMRWLRYRACNTSKEILQLQETYIPGCDDMAKTSRVAYLAMPFAGKNRADPIFKLDWAKSGKREAKPIEDVATQKTLFAQLIAAVYSMHAVGAWHNDLNGGNVLLDGDRLALIDFGLMGMKGHRTMSCGFGRCVDGANRDGNNIWKWGAVLANCSKNARYYNRKELPVFLSPSQGHFFNDPNSQKRRQQRTLNCIREKWNPEERFIKALKVMFLANTKKSRTQHIEDLYHTDFVQKHLPKTDTRYQVPGTASCDTWSSSKLTDEAEKNNARKPSGKDRRKRPRNFTDYKSPYN